ncbi:unnamed protein product [Darwinula stevensoni]|uniref:Uncharacterized protein n=1 Tax=Darwinula stevensoni TaxID=69355 RepID=A0A7R8X726_9CRUS|nr:unnamed protein product [Darwinula stevensoni]CAG0888737.1 unnamed protein product [Darwinula stevensoni]
MWTRLMPVISASGCPVGLLIDFGEKSAAKDRNVQISLTKAPSVSSLDFSDDSFHLINDDYALQDEDFLKTIEPAKTGIIPGLEEFAGEPNLDEILSGAKSVLNELQLNVQEQEKENGISEENGDPWQDELLPVLQQKNRFIAFETPLLSNQKEPEKKNSIEEVVRRYSKLRASLTLCSSVTPSRSVMKEKEQDQGSYPSKEPGTLKSFKGSPKLVNSSKNYKNIPPLQKVEKPAFSRSASLRIRGSNPKRNVTPVTQAAASLGVSPKVLRKQTPTMNDIRPQPTQHRSLPQERKVPAVKVIPGGNIKTNKSGGAPLKAILPLAKMIKDGSKSQSSSTEEIASLKPELKPQHKVSRRATQESIKPRSSLTKESNKHESSISKAPVNISSKLKSLKENLILASAKVSPTPISSVSREFGTPEVLKDKANIVGTLASSNHAYLPSHIHKKPDLVEKEKGLVRITPSKLPRPYSCPASPAMKPRLLTALMNKENML